MRKQSWTAHGRGGALIKLLLGLAVVFAALALAWMLLLPVVFAGYLSNKTGFSVRVDSLAVNPFTGSVKARGLVLSNPSEFQVPDFVHLRAFELDAELSSLWGDRLVVDRAVVDVEEVALVKDRRGRSNFALFQERLGGGASSEPAQSASRSPGSPKSRPFLVRELDLRFDRLLLVDCTSGTPVSRQIDLNFHQGYRDVTSTVQIAVPIVSRIGSLGGTIDDFAGQFGVQARDAARKAGQTLRETEKKAEKAIKGFLDSLREHSN